LIEAGCRISAKEIGDDCVIESAVVLDEGSVIGNGCRICAGERIGRNELVPDGTVVFGNGRRRADKTDQVPTLPSLDCVDKEISTENTGKTMCMAQRESRQGESSMACTMIYISEWNYILIEVDTGTDSN
jgi:carbonic anhydrase/acetyltransferase-like protein (isoleucine patch superfamily)